MKAYDVFRNLFSALAVTAVVSTGAATIAYGQSGPFQGLAGNWSGNGNFELEDGSKERIRCRATYSVNGDSTGMNLNLRCASDSYTIDMQTNVVAQGSDLSGTWTERTRGVSGGLSGKAARGSFHVDVSAPGFTARLNLATQGNRQTVNITSDSQLKSARISLSR